MNHMKRTTIIFALSLALLLTLSGCAELDSHSKTYRFEGSINLYKSSIRWGEWVGALQLYRKPEDKQVAPPSEQYLRHLEKIKVKHIEELNSQMNPDEKTGQTFFLIEYHMDNSTKIHSIRHKVLWWHDTESKTWFAKTPLPKEFDMSEQEARTIKLSPRN